MKIVYEGGSAEIIEKKSRFIADVASVKTEEEATAFIADIKKKYWDCRHNCSAFVIGDKQQLTRCSDDGEPAGTAGRPMLDTIVNMGVTDVCVVVSRYFGGTLLGTGGLVRAYGGATKAGLEASVLAESMTGRRVTCKVTYDFVGKLQYASAEMGLTELSNEYAEGVTLEYLVPEEQVEGFTSRVVELTCGKAIIDVSDPIGYVVVDGGPVISE